MPVKPPVILKKYAGMLQKVREQQVNKTTNESDSDQTDLRTTTFFKKKNPRHILYLFNIMTNDYFCIFSNEVEGYRVRRKANVVFAP